jgi:hypothetical protein
VLPKKRKKKLKGAGYGGARVTTAMREAEVGRLGSKAGQGKTQDPTSKIN